MVATVHPKNLPERLVWFTLLGTYGLYYLGAQFIWVPFMAWGLAAYLGWQWWNESVADASHTRVVLSPVLWIWIMAILGIEVALLIGHANFDLGVSLMLKSTLNRWVRQWALLALFPLLGCLSIRPAIIIRGVCWVGLQTLFALFLAGVGVFILKRPEWMFVSPLSTFGGGEIFYEVNVLGTILDNNELRLQLFAPWPPALGLIGNLYFWISTQEGDRFWRLLGGLGALGMILGSSSRLGLVALPLVGGILLLLTWARKPMFLIGLGVVSFMSAIFATPIVQAFNNLKSGLIQARAGSSKTRATLQELALRDWRNEAPIWGHGTIAPEGPRVVGFMPIGSHHQWFGILYTHGAVGFSLLAIAFISSFLALILQFYRNSLARVAIALWLVLFLFTWGENLETLAYMFWPALLLMGIAYQNTIRTQPSSLN